MFFHVHFTFNTSSNTRKKKVKTVQISFRSRFCSEKIEVFWLFHLDFRSCTYSFVEWTCFARGMDLLRSGKRFDSPSAILYVIPENYRTPSSQTQEVLIKGLANSRTFQRFALRTHENIQALKKDQVRNIETLKEQVDTVLDEAARGAATAGSASAKQNASGNVRPVPPIGGVVGFFRAFAREVKKDFGGGGRTWYDILWGKGGIIFEGSVYNLYTNSDLLSRGEERERKNFGRLKLEVALLLVCGGLWDRIMQ